MSNAELRLRRGLLLSCYSLSLAFACAGIRACTLSTHRQSLAMADTPVAADVHQSFDVHLCFAAKSSLNFVVRCDDAPDLRDLIISQIGDPLVKIDASLGENRFGCRSTDPVNIGEADLGTLFLWQIYTGNTSHGVSLTLTLFVFWILADHAHNAVAPDDLAIDADLLD